MGTIKTTLHIDGNNLSSDLVKSKVFKTFQIPSTASYTGMGKNVVDTSTGTLLDAPKRQLVYVRNLDADNFLNINVTGPITIMKILPGEFAIFQRMGGTDMTLLADTANINVEVAFWELE